jgi:hypothetical protein
MSNTSKEIKDYIKRQRRIALDSSHLLLTPEEKIRLNERINICENLLNRLHVPLNEWG